MFLSQLIEYVKQHGPVGAVVVSGARASGRARKYPYWGAVRYKLMLTSDGARVKMVPEERASSDRRSKELAIADARAIAEREGRIYTIAPMGTVRDEWIAEQILRELQNLRHDKKAECV